MLQVQCCRAHLLLIEQADAAQDGSSVQLAMHSQHPPRTSLRRSGQQFSEEPTKFKLGEEGWPTEPSALRFLLLRR